MNIDPIAMQQQMEQAEAGLISLSKIIASYYKTLIDEGVKRQDALQLCIMAQSDILRPRQF